MNYINDIQLKENNGYNVIIEIPKGTKSKLELVDETFDKVIEVRKMLYKYPFYYGCFPQTYAADKDPLDAIILSNKKFKSLDIVNVQPIAVVKTIDKNEIDDKVICVLKDENINTQKYLNKVRNFLTIYKGKNSKTTIDPNLYDINEALKVIEETNKFYNRNISKKQHSRLKVVF